MKIVGQSVIFKLLPCKLYQRQRIQSKEQRGVRKMSINTHTYFSYSNPQIITTERQFADVLVPCRAFRRKCSSLKMRYTGHHQLLHRSASKAIRVVLSEMNVISSPPEVEEFTVSTTFREKENELKITVEVSETKTQEIYDTVISKMVEDAQPIPGFRRTKGGKTPNIPEDVLLEILGPSKVYEQVIRNVINISIADYVAKEGLAVGKDVKIEQSFEDLEAGFEPGCKFRFDAIIECKYLK